MPALVDRVVVDDLLAQIGADGARSVLELFIAESRGYLATIEAAAAGPAEAAGCERARRAAHSLKSSAGQIGAAALAAAAIEVERAAAVSPAALPAAAAVLAKCARDTGDALHRLLRAIE